MVFTTSSRLNSIYHRSKLLPGGGVECIVQIALPRFITTRSSARIAALKPHNLNRLMDLMEKCHNGYLSTVIGLGLVITALLIVIASMLFGVIPAAISGLIFLGWAIPAIAQGVGNMAICEKRNEIAFRGRVGREGR